MGKKKFGKAQANCLVWLANKESGFNHRAVNPSSGAYGIPQSLPAIKLRSAGSDWQTNPRTQVRWMLSYVKGRYKTPCNAKAWHLSHNWY